MARADNDPMDFGDVAEIDRADPDVDLDLDFDPDSVPDLGFEEIALPDEADDADVLDQFESVGSDDDDYPYESDR
jgi:hypothetical protein